MLDKTLTASTNDAKITFNADPDNITASVEFSSADAFLETILVLLKPTLSIPLIKDATIKYLQDSGKSDQAELICNAIDQLIRVVANADRNGMSSGTKSQPVVDPELAFRVLTPVEGRGSNE